jgi:hypothetical protein
MQIIVRLDLLRKADQFAVDPTCYRLKPQWAAHLSQ